MALMLKLLSRTGVFSISGRALGHPLLKGGYTGHEKTYSGDLDISPGLAKT